MCNIILNQPTIAQLSGNNILKLRVWGEAIDCPQNGPVRNRPLHEIQVDIEITLIVNGQPSPNAREAISAVINDLSPDFQSVATSGIFNWDITTKQFPTFPCGSTVRIKATCHSDPNCFAEQDFVIGCGDCPTVELVLVSVSDVCTKGKRTATFRVIVSNPQNPSVYEIDFGDGSDSTFVFDASQNPASFTHDYEGGDYIAIVNSILPENCPSSAPVNVAVKPCDENCPTVQLELVSVSDCNKDQTRTVTFRVHVGNIPSTDCVYEIDFGDGTDQNILFDNTTASPIIITHDYVAGNYSAIVNSFLPSGCQDSNSVLVQVPPCTTECPDDIEFEIIDSNGNRFRVIDNNEGILEAVSNNPFHLQVDCLPRGKYIVRVTSPGPAGITFTWRENENPPVQNNSRDFSFTLDADTESVTVTIEKNNCPPLSETFILRLCKDDCCPRLQALTASCMTRCPASTIVTFTATGDDLDCAEVFSWDFGDGTTQETNQPTTVHTYASFDSFDAEVVMIRPDDCRGDRVQRARTVVSICPPSCWCSFLSIITAFLFLAFLSLMPMIACAADPVTKQILITALIIVAILMVIFWLWWLIDPCCRPTSCEMLRILFWVLSWALIIVGILAIMQFCISGLPFVLFYTVMQQVILALINDQECRGGAPQIFSWPFPPCR